MHNIDKVAAVFGLTYLNDLEKASKNAAVGDRALCDCCPSVVLYADEAWIGTPAYSFRTYETRMADEGLSITSVNITEENYPELHAALMSGAVTPEDVVNYINYPSTQCPLRQWKRIAGLD